MNFRGDDEEGSVRPVVYICIEKLRLFTVCANIPKKCNLGKPVLFASQRLTTYTNVFSKLLNWPAMKEHVEWRENFYKTLLSAFQVIIMQPLVELFIISTLLWSNF